ncbi:MAG TPA: hypothetical protein VK153_01880 [Candidatus Paceibacterota bacterium]|nr:hypothetical protein [Candidatus Paceibacterota bacterium]
MKKYFVFLFIVFTFLSLNLKVFADASSGFIPGQIWYSNDNLVAGETVNIHTAVWNAEKNSISVKVQFYDKDTILGTRDIVLSSLELKDVYIPWKVTSGDHTISAKITSSVVTISGKKENVTLERSSTSNDKQFVPVVAKNEKGQEVESSIENKLGNAGEKINEMLPEEVSTFISDKFAVVENFREEKSGQVDIAKEKANKEMEVIKSREKENGGKVASASTDTMSATEKPITYIKVFLFTILSFILASKFIFYGLLIIILFLILRSIYRRIRG